MLLMEKSIVFTRNPNQVLFHTTSRRAPTILLALFAWAFTSLSLFWLELICSPRWLNSITCSTKLLSSASLHLTGSLAMFVVVYGGYLHVVCHSFDIECVQESLKVILAFSYYHSVVGIADDFYFASGESVPSAWVLDIISFIMVLNSWGLRKSPCLIPDGIGISSVSFSGSLRCESKGWGLTVW